MKSSELLQKYKNGAAGFIRGFTRGQSDDALT